MRICILSLVVIIAGCSILGLDNEENEVEENIVEEFVEEVEEEIYVEEIPLIREGIEGATHINNVTVEPSCIEGQNGGEIKFSLTKAATRVRYQVREANQNFQDVFTVGSRNEGAAKFIICDECKGADFYLKPNTAYSLRILFDQANTESSDHHLIDTRNESEYITKVCKNEKIKIRSW